MNCAELRERAFPSRSGFSRRVHAEWKAFRYGWDGRRVAVTIVLCLAYFLLDRVTVEFQLWNGISARYPPSGLLLATLFGLEPRYGWFLYVTAVICNVVNYHQSPLLPAFRVETMVLFAGYWCAAEFLRKRLDPYTPFHTLRDVIAFLAYRPRPHGIFDRSQARPEPQAHEVPRQPETRAAYLASRRRRSGNWSAIRCACVKSC